MTLEELLVTLKMMDIYCYIYPDNLDMVIYLEHKDSILKDTIIDLLQKYKYDFYITYYNNICVSIGYHSYEYR